MHTCIHVLNIYVVCNQFIFIFALYMNVMSNNGIFNVKVIIVSDVFSSTADTTLV